MIIELCIHRAHAGRLDEFRRLSQSALHPPALAHGAQLLFCAGGESGALNELVTAWSHPSQAAFDQVRQALRSDATWLAAAREAGRLLLTQTRQLVATTSFTEVSPPPPNSRLLDLRCYSFKPEALQDFLPICATDGLPGQRRHCGHLVFHATSITGTGDQLVQAWAYADHQTYEQGQRNLFRDAAWAQGYRQRVIHLVDVQEHRLLRPLSTSKG
jgi:hypothetical protein